MTDNYINISEIKATTKYEELRIQFFNEIVKLKLEQPLLDKRQRAYTLRPSGVRGLCCSAYVLK